MIYVQVFRANEWRNVTSCWTKAEATSQLDRWRYYFTENMRLAIKGDLGNMEELK